MRDHPSPGGARARVLEPAPRRRVPELDGLRGAAILLVLIWHYLVSPLDVAPGSIGAFFKQSLSLTWSGVDLFFVLSGFLIGGILMEHRGSRSYWRAFYVRRACRILPPYLLVVGSSLAAALAMSALPAIGWMVEGKLPMWSYLSFTQNLVMAHQNTFGSEWLSVTWSLAVEEQFYLCLPLLVRLIPPRLLPLVLAPVAALAPIVRLLLEQLHPHGGFAAYVLLPARADALLLGVLAAWTLRQPEAARWLANRRRVGYAILLALAAGTAMLTRWGPGIGPESSVRIVSVVGLSWLALLYLGILLLALLDPAGWLAWLTRRAWLRLLGTISYGVYLIHQIVLALAHTLILGQEPVLASARDAAVNVVALAVTLVLATLSWRVMEKPIVRWGQSHRY